MVWNGQHFLGLEDLSKEDIQSLIRRASHFLEAGNRYEPNAPLTGKIIANLFMENSTRTRCSFTIATKRLGGDCIDLLGGTSSASKGETLVDTAMNLEAMGVAGIAVRCSEECGPSDIASNVGIPVINAGSGTASHPTQALLDAGTLLHHFGCNDLSGQHIAIIGDITHSRVARSNVIGLTKLGAKVTLVGPQELLPTDPTCETSTDFDAVLQDVSACMMLRVQFERDAQVDEDYRDKFGFTEERFAHFTGAVLHPGPINRGLEIDDCVASCNSPQNKILSQVSFGVATRMAILEHLIG